MSSWFSKINSAALSQYSCWPPNDVHSPFFSSPNRAINCIKVISSLFSHEIATVFLFWGEINCFGLLGDQTNLAFLSIPRLTFNDKKSCCCSSIVCWVKIKSENKQIRGQGNKQEPFASLFLKSQRSPGKSFLLCTLNFLLTRSLFIRFIWRIAGHNVRTLFRSIHPDRKITHAELKRLRNSSYGASITTTWKKPTRNSHSRNLSNLTPCKHIFLMYRGEKHEILRQKTGWNREVLLRFQNQIDFGNILCCYSCRLLDRTLP